MGNFNFDATRIPEIQGKCEKIFIYHSKDDNCVPFEQGEKVAEYFPQAKFEIFEDQGHFSCEEFPQLVANIKR
ncbi:MAG: alpha/beta hydrolase [Patescibacteria group bacterium]|nr:alpha/beta hydrolase [Patescibacteria group bacterium]